MYQGVNMNHTPNNGQFWYDHHVVLYLLESTRMLSVGLYNRKYVDSYRVYGDYSDSKSYDCSSDVATTKVYSAALHLGSLERLTMQSWQ